MIGETAELAVMLRLIDEMSPGLSKAQGNLGRFGTSAGAASSKVGLVSRATTGAGQALSHFGGVVGGVVKSAAILGGSFALFAGPAGVGAAIKSSINFQRQMELVATQAGATQKEVDQMSAALLKLAPTVGVGPEELAMGLYHVESAGYRSAQALTILKFAAEGARVGNANLEDTANALVGAMQSNIKGAQNLGQAMGTINAIIGSGNMRMQDFVSSLSSGILAASRTFGVSLGSIGSALATLTDEAVPAQEASTRLRMTLSLLGAPTSKAADQLKSIGLGTLSLANAMRGPGGIVDAVKLLHDHMQKAGLIDAEGKPTSEGAQLLSRAFGGGRSSATIMTLVGNIGLLERKWTAVQKGADGFGAAVDKNAKTAAQKFADLEAALGVLGIKIGDVVAGPVADMATSLTQILTDNAGNISSFVGMLANGFGVAAKAAGTLLGVLKQVHDMPVAGTALDLLAGGAIAGKVSSVLFGKNPFTWLLGSLFGKRGGALGAAGGIASKLGGAIPVYVVNMGPGGMGGGLPAAAGAGGLSLFGIGASVLGGIGVAAAWKMLVQDPQMDQVSRDLVAKAQKQLASHPSQSDLSTSLRAIRTGERQIEAMPPGTIQLYQGQYDTLKKLESIYVQAIQDATLKGPTAAWRTRPAVEAQSHANRRTLADLTPIDLKRATKEGVGDANRDLPKRRDMDNLKLAIGLGLVQAKRDITRVEAAGLLQVHGAISLMQGAVVAALGGGFSSVVQAIGGISLPAFLPQNSPTRNNPNADLHPPKPGSREGQNRGHSLAVIQVHATTSTRSNDSANVVQQSYGPTPSRAGAAGVLL